MQHFFAYLIWQRQCYLLFFSSLQYLEFISLHMGFSRKGGYVSQDIVYADYFNFLFVCNTSYIPQRHCEDKEHWNVFGIADFIETRKAK